MTYQQFSDNPKQIALRTIIMTQQEKERKREGGKERRREGEKERRREGEGGIEGEKEKKEQSEKWHSNDLRGQASWSIKTPL